MVTAWIALTRSDLESGCMKVIHGTHTTNQLPHVDTFHKDNLLSRGQEIAVEVDERRAVRAPDQGARLRDVPSGGR